MTSGMDWRGRVGDVWAAEWRRTDRSLADLSRHLDEAIAWVAPDVGKALDIGSGAGATSLALYAARPGLSIMGVDLSDELVAVARERAGETADHGPRFLSGDALTVATAEAPFDLLCSRHGVMFFADPVEALSILRRAARNGARLVFSCFAERAANGFATLADAAIGAAPPPDAGYAPGPFAFSDQQQVAAWLKESGWRPDGAVRVGFDYVVGEGDDPVADALSFLSRIGPAARALSQAALPERNRIADTLRAGLEASRVGNRLPLQATAWIWQATA
ncbi:class I SAM-dependent methyltransferase [Sphingomonas sp. CFBP8993]|uniref:class I SAM-dependent methyltransferase n=1 Tax=Sphingomonas sp. CFBP8993 TaxID=3096526 RepID=UPI002A6B3005|nr:class I SAM-dependent methyltransferase [Sphingomonas sp. CFBP8993]MDY0958789.1 class I SAM-dependent methyltransferase [Sphingomonas sp. CFBP8993]